jgi:hypothetical protein
MLYKLFMFIIGTCALAKKGHSQCLIWSLSATSSSCLTGANLGAYEVTGSLFTWPYPSSGTLTISGGNGTSVTYNAPFGTTVNYTLPVTAGHGNNYTVTASYSATSCDKQKSYSSPNCCSVAVSNTTPSVCESKTLTITTTGTTGGTYTWTGPNGFSSSQQSPVISNATSAIAGIYQVYLVNGICTSPVQSVSVSVKSKPTSKSIIH